jgi:hypothetical protein
MRVQMKIYFGFGGGFLLILLLLALLPRPLFERFQTLQGDQIRLVEIYQRITRDLPIDVAFIGTSHTMNGIDDRGVEEALATAGVRVNVANLGMEWIGRDMHLFLAKQLLANKTPQLIVLEINEHEPPYGHILMPYVASASDMFCCEFWMEWNFPTMFLLFLKEQLYWALSWIWSSPPTSTRMTRASDYGWAPIDRSWNPQMADNRSFGDRIESVMGSGVRAAAYRLSSTFGDQAVRQIVDLARSKNVKIVFLYLPEYIYAVGPGPQNVLFYDNLGPVLLPPQEVVANKANWGDFAHLNKNGALKLVPYLSAMLTDYVVAH